MLCKRRFTNERSTCRHLENGNAVCRFPIPSEVGENFYSSSYNFCRELGHELRFQAFYFFESRDDGERDEATSKFGVFISNFGAFSPVGLRLRCRVLGKQSEVVVESDWDRFVFHRGKRERWPFKVARSKLEDARKVHDELFAEFEVELDESVLQGASRQLQPNEDGEMPYTPGDPNGTPFILHVPDVRERVARPTRRRFEDVEFILRFFPPDRRPDSSDFEFVLTRFLGRRLVRFAFEWAVENSEKETKFRYKEVLEFEVCGCPPNERCDHARFRKSWHHGSARELEEFAGDRPVRLILKLRPASPATSAQSESPALSQGSSTTDAAREEPQKQAKSPFVQRTPIFSPAKQPQNPLGPPLFSNPKQNADEQREQQDDEEEDEENMEDEEADVEDKEWVEPEDELEDSEDESEDESDDEESGDLIELQSSPKHNRTIEPSAAKRPRPIEEGEDEATPSKIQKTADARLLSLVVDGKEFEIERDLLIDESAFFAKKVAKQEPLVECLPAEINSETMGAKTCVESIKRTFKQPGENLAAAVLFTVEHEDAELLRALEFAWKSTDGLLQLLRSEEFRRVYRERPGFVERIVNAM
ncbi:hypothetical protein M3Y99_00517900 [Aphelenchoides fujianensis]|nr:hypothetical protein M3Y99_00517900 [Aphelenchoides fujianensis]